MLVALPSCRTLMIVGTNHRGHDGATRPDAARALTRRGG